MELTFKNLKYKQVLYLLFKLIHQRGKKMISTRDLSMESGHYARMGDQECQKIHMATLEILERTGVDVHDEKARKILEQGGADVEGLRVRLPEHMVTQALATVPQRITLYDRNKKPAIRAWGHNTYYGGGSDCLNILDHRTGERRRPVLSDVVEAAKVMDSLPEINFVMSLILPVDVDQRIYDRYQMEVMLNHTTKTIVFVAPDFEGCKAAVEMCEAVAGGEKAFRRHPFATCYINVTSGLVANDEALQKIPVCVDNTTCTAALQRPMDFGVDIVILSISKFISGNGFILGGVVVGPEELIEDIRWNTTEFVGSIMQPTEAWMTLQYMETLGMRMEKHSSNAQKVAEFLEAHANVTHVNYSGLKSHPQHELACEQMKAHGGLMSFVVKNGMDGAATVMNNLKLVVHAVTFGTSRTICMHPPTITHEHMTKQERESVGIDDGLIRLSVGIETPKDIIADLEQALNLL